MSATSNWLEEHLLDHNLNANALAVAITQASVWVSLHDADTTDVTSTALATEISVGQYARVQMTAGWTIAAAAGVTTAKNTGAITFPTQTSNPYTPTHFGVFNASTSGQLLYHGSVSPSNPVGINDTPSFAATSIELEGKGAFSDYLELENMKHVLNNDEGNSIKPASTYVALFTADPDDTGASGEVSGGSYARQEITADWTLDGTGGVWTAKNASEVDFGTATANWGNVDWFGVFDALTGGSLFYHAQLDNLKNVNNGDSAKFGISPSALSIEIQ